VTVNTTNDLLNYSVEPDGPTTRKVMETIIEQNPKRVVARSPDGYQATIVGFDTPHFDKPHSRHLLYLTVAGQLR